jgi:hypothetical protein
VRKWLIFGATFVGGLFLIVLFLFGGFAPEKSTAVELKALNTLNVLSAFALGMGLVSIGAVHGRRLIYARKGWQYSLALFIGLAFAIVVGLVQHYTGQHDEGLWHYLNQRIVFEALITPLGATMFSLLAFYMVSAAFRAFRIRSAEAGLMMVSALVVMLAQMPPVQAALPEAVTFKQWILTTVNTGAQRAILIGSGLAGLVVGLRIWLGVERGTFFDQK